MEILVGNAWLEQACLIILGSLAEESCSYQNSIHVLLEDVLRVQ